MSDEYVKLRAENAVAEIADVRDVIDNVPDDNPLSFIGSAKGMSPEDREAYKDVLAIGLWAILRLTQR